MPKAARFKKTSLRRGFFCPKNAFNHETFVIKLLAKSVNTASYKGCSVLRFFPR